MGNLTSPFIVEIVYKNMQFCRIVCYFLEAVFGIDGRCAK